jgi:hypothetical protein
MGVSYNLVAFFYNLAGIIKVSDSSEYIAAYLDVAPKYQAKD